MLKNIEMNNKIKNNNAPKATFLAWLYFHPFFDKEYDDNGSNYKK